MIPFLSRRALWLVLLVAATTFLFWSNAARRERIQQVSAIGLEPGPRQDGLRYLIVPEHIPNTFDWLLQTEQMLTDGGWRVRHFPGDNAPFGREVHAASPYRWWLGTVTWAGQLWQPKPVAAAVERAALWADPLLHLLLLFSLAGFVAWSFGSVAAATVVLLSSALFPFAAGFLPGVPEEFALFLLLTPWTLLPLVVPQLSAAAAARAGAWYLVAGAIGGLALWVNLTLQVPLLAGLFLGGLLAAALTRSSPAGVAPEAWRAWGAGGAGMILVGYLLEYAPQHLGEWEFRAVHPLYGIGWLGVAELLTRLTRWIQDGQPPRTPRALAGLAAGVVAAAALPIALWRTGNIGFLNANLLSFRLSKQTDGVIAPNLLEWLERPGGQDALLATLVPLALLSASVWLLLRRASRPGLRYALLLTAGPVLVALGLAGVHLRWWQLFGALLLVVAPLTVYGLLQEPRSRLWRWAWGALLVLALTLGLRQLWPARVPAGGQVVLTLPEVEGLVERDLAHSLVKRLGPSAHGNLLAPPSMTTALHYYAGIRGLATLSWENKDGLSVALRIVISTSREEAHALVQSRGVTHLILPSWDPFYETYTRPASVQTGELFYNSLQRWVVPMWLRPIPYQVPQIGGFEHQSLTLFEVVEEQEQPVGMSRMTEYFIEMADASAARAAGEALRRYPADFSALIARAQLAAAAGDAAAFSEAFETVQQRLTARADRTLPWDRRVSLAIVLARGKRLDLARVQAERALQQLDEPRLRQLTTYSLYHFMILLKAVELEISDPALRALAHELLPAEFRGRL